jgi:hypothetical protein
MSTKYFEEFQGGESRTTTGRTITEPDILGGRPHRCHTTYVVPSHAPKLWRHRILPSSAPTILVLAVLPP